MRHQPSLASSRLLLFTCSCCSLLYEAGAWRVLRSVHTFLPCGAASALLSSSSRALVFYSLTDTDLKPAFLLLCVMGEASPEEAPAEEHLRNQVAQLGSS